VPDDRTHEATPRRLARAIADGDFALSGDLVSAAVLASFAGLCALGGPELVHAVSGLWLLVLDAAHGGVVRGAQQALAAPLQRVLLAVAPFFGAIVVAALLVSVVQSGFAIGPRGAERASSRSLSRLRQAWSPARWGDTAFGLLKLAVLAWALLSGVVGSLPGLLDAWQRSAAELGAIAAVLLRTLLLRAAVSVAFIGLADLLYQRLRRRQRLRMSARELREEQRQSEGDPQLRSARRQRAAELAAQATLEELAGAALVVVGAGDRVVALRFDAERDETPVLWLKASGVLAQRVVDRAASLRLPVADDVALCAELYQLELSQAAPAAAYQVLAQWLARASSPAAARGAPR
jgi:flagellar biosynthetic protein FlhB